MPAFSVHVDRDELAVAEFAVPTVLPKPEEGTAHHGARDPRQAVRERSGRARADQAARGGGGRSYAFRRS
ncbi:hypothetical protein [Actinoplanes sp. N902-109]|uniref:hypothetical protein n=1 Tax=Actinoplanes sp. (strain N902-109) TaxID=649831 RepID=UPI0003294129|nr:hypothetical protein [Actinoplanes sp. N902-109]AGL18698.1 hypothetical protein L083_5188 [Actinoplanes sp. N902-109]